MAEDFNPEDIKTLRRLTSILNGGELTKEEFVKAFEAVVKIVLTIEQRIVGNNKKAQDANQTAFDDLTSANKTDLTAFKAVANNLVTNAIARMNATADKRLGAMEKAVKKLRDGKDADEELMMAKLQMMIPTVQDIVKFLPQAGEGIRDSLELLQGDDRLDITAIRGIEKLQAEIAKANKNGTPVRFSGATRGFFVYIGGVKKGIIQTLDFVPGTNMAIAYSKVNGRDTITFNASGGSGSGISVETPPETPNASITVFTVSAKPKWIVADGTTYYEGAGYSYAALQVTLDVPPSSFIRAII